MKTLKFITISFFILLTLQIVGFQLVGKRAIHIECMKELKTLAIGVDSVGIYSPYCHLTNQEQKEIKTSLSETFKEIEFIENKNEFDEKYRLKENGYGMGYQVDKLNFLRASTIEYNGTIYYGETWESDYIWLLFKWVKIRQENTGQS